MNEVEEVFRRMVDEIVTERLAALPRPRVKSTLDEQAQEEIRQLEIISRKPYLTKKDLAIYLDCSERAIEEWTARPPQKNPLPAVRVGRDLRIKREKADEWAEREGQRYKLKQVS